MMKWILQFTLEGVTTVRKCPSRGVAYFWANRLRQKYGDAVAVFVSLNDTTKES
jgi:hypothetical protein